MEIIKKFMKAGEPTVSGDLEFMSKMRDRLPIFQHTSAIEMNKRLIAQYESVNRYEYVVKNDNGETLATMVISADDCDIHTGKPALFPMIAGSLYPGLLFGAYRWLYEIAKDEGIKFIIKTKTKGYVITHYYKELT